MKKLLLPIASLVIIAIIFGAIYAVGQQVLRLGANDPQVQIAEDAAASLNAGMKPESLLQGSVKVDESLAAFMQIYDMHGKLVAGNGYVDTQPPIVPIGVLTSADTGRYNFVTWQPIQGVRIAAVAVKADTFYVLAGRNMREIERREDKVLLLSLLGWIASSVILVVAFLLGSYYQKSSVNSQK